MERKVSKHRCQTVTGKRFVFFEGKMTLSFISCAVFSISIHRTSHLAAGRSLSSNFVRCLLQSRLSARE